jgi:hypothetical protein
MNAPDETVEPITHEDERLSPPARVPPRYAPRRVALVALAIVAAATATMVIVLSQSWPQLGTGNGEAIPTPAPPSSIRGIVEARIGVDRVLQVSDTPDPAHRGRIAVVLAFHAAEDYTHDRVVADIKSDVLSLMRALYTSGKPIGRVTIVAEQPYEDNSGDYTWCPITRVVLAPEAATRTAWRSVTAGTFWREVQVLQEPRFCT